MEQEQLNARAHADHIKAKQKLRLFLSLLVILVFGWVCGLLATLKTNIAIFLIALSGYAVFGAGQGIYLFIVIGLMNPIMRQDWKKFLCRITRC